VAHAYDHGTRERYAPNPWEVSTRHLAWPALYALALWAAALAPARALALLPDPGVWWLLGTVAPLAANGPRQLTPRDVAAAFELGGLAERARRAALNAAQSPQAAKVEQAALARATEVLGAPLPLTRHDLVEGVAAAAEAVATARGPLAAALGVFSLTNFMGILAVAGIGVSLGPVLALLAKPLRDLIRGLLEVARPLARALVTVAKPAREPAAWAVCLYVAVAAGRFDASEGARQQVAILAALLAPTAYGASLKLHPTEGKDEEKIRMESMGAVCGLWGFAYLAPLAAAYESKTIAILAVACLYTALGMFCLPFFFGWLVGFSGEGACQRSMAASAVLLAGLYATRALADSPPWLKPFEPGVAVFGSIGIGLAGLIRCHWWACKRDEQLYVAVNALYFIALVTIAGLGAALNVPSARNTAVTFLILWGTEKGSEVTRGWAIWPAVLVGSVALFYATLYLRANPEIVYSLVAVP